MSLAVVPPNGLWPHRWEIVGWGAWDAVSGAARTASQASTRITGGVGANGASDADNGDTISFWVPMDSGTWSLMWMYYTAANTGIFDITLSGASVATGIDLYSGSTVNNIVSTVTGITVAAPGVKTLTFTTNGKNASSTDYSWSCQLITLVRTGA